MIEKAKADSLPEGVVLGDCEYGNTTSFRDMLDVLGLQYALAVQGTTMLRRVGTRGRLGERMSVAELGVLPRDCRPSRQTLSSQSDFASSSRVQRELHCAPPLIHASISSCALSSASDAYFLSTPYEHPRGQST